MEKKKEITNPIKAIRAKCLECSCDSPAEGAQCPVTKCALYPFRFGKNPYRTPREMTPEQKKKMAERLHKPKIVSEPLDAQ